MHAKGNGSAANPHYTDAYRDLFDKKYLVMQYHFVQFFAEHLADVSRVFEADLQSVLVLALVGQMEIEARIRLQLDDAGLTPTDAMGRVARINISSIAEISGIPRETVRRKAEALARQGWIERDVNGFWHMKLDSSDGAPVRREFLDIDRRQMERVCQFLGQMHALAIEAQARSEIDPAGKDSPAG